MRERLGDIISAVLLLAMATAMFLLTLGFPPPAQRFDPGTAAFPRMISVAFGVLAVAQLLRPGETEGLPRGGSAARVAGVLGLLVLYAALLEPLGFIAATALFVLGALLVSGTRRISYLALGPALISVVLFYVFYELLEVSLPTGFVEGLLP